VRAYDAKYESLHITLRPMYVGLSGAVHVGLVYADEKGISRLLWYRLRKRMKRILLYFVKVFTKIFDELEAFKIPGNSRPGIETAPIPGNSR